MWNELLTVFFPRSCPQRHRRTEQVYQVSAGTFQVNWFQVLGGLVYLLEHTHKITLPFRTWARPPKTPTSPSRWSRSRLADTVPARRGKKPQTSGLDKLLLLLLFYWLQKQILKTGFCPSKKLALEKLWWTQLCFKISHLILLKWM